MKILKSTLFALSLVIASIVILGNSPASADTVFEYRSGKVVEKAIGDYDVAALKKKKRYKKRLKKRRYLKNKKRKRAKRKLRKKKKKFRLAKKYKRQVVRYRTKYKPGTIVVETKKRFLYLVMPGGKAMRYGVSVGKQGFSWKGRAKIRAKKEWPTWTPPKEMIERKPHLIKWKDGQPGGPNNPLGARALYLYQGKVDTLYRIHGTNAPWSIGKAASSGCVRLLNSEIQDLYTRVKLGSSVVIL